MGFGGDADAMQTTVMWGFIFIGAGAVIAGLVGIALPARHRLAAVLSLVVGAGVGVAALAVGTHRVSNPDDAASAFLVASVLGFVAVVATSALLWIRLGHDEPPPPRSDDGTP
jgi:hypothetical protein